MKRLIVAAAAASLLVAASSTGASAFGMNVPKSVVVAAISAPAINSNERSFIFPPLTLLSVAGDYAAHLRAEWVSTFAPGIISGIGAAYHRAFAAPVSASAPETIAI